MRRALIAALALLTLVWGGSASATEYSGVSTMTFKNGVSPTVDYAGCEDTFITAATADSAKNFGSGDSLKVSGGAWTGNQPGIHKMLLRFDISALADSGLVSRSLLAIYQCLGYTGSFTDSVFVYRAGHPWVEGTGAAGGTTSTTSCRWRNYGSVTQQWGTAGASLHVLRNISVGASSGATVDSSVAAARLAGADFLTTGAGSFDAPATPEALNLLYTGIASTRKGWLIFDITRLMRLWQIGQIDNEGVIVEIHNNANNKLFAFYSSEKDDVLYRPELINIWYDPTSGSGSGGRRTIGNAPGGLH